MDLSIIVSIISLVLVIVNSWLVAIHSKKRTATASKNIPKEIIKAEYSTLEKSSIVLLGVLSLYSIYNIIHNLPDPTGYTVINIVNISLSAIVIVLTVLFYFLLLSRKKKETMITKRVLSLMKHFN